MEQNLKIYNGPKLIIALDNIDEFRAGEIMEKLKNFSGKVVFKLNDLIFELGVKGISELLGKTSFQVMLDPKWYDISETLINYLRKLSQNSELKERTEFLTVHASNGKKALKRLMDEKQKLGLNIKIFAVTALTSLEDEDTQAIFDETSKHSVLKLAKESLESGVDGIVCSAKEAQILREVFSNYNFEIITPGVRFDLGKSHDQKRITTPELAIRNGSTHIVMGRPILESDDLIYSVQRFFDEIKGVDFEITGEYEFEKLLYNGKWIDLLKYIGAIYERSEGGKYFRLASKLLSTVYLNIGSAERNYLILERAGRELSQQLSEKNIEADVIMGAQMGSIRLSSYLAEKMGVEESIYTEKTGEKSEQMSLKRHDIDLKGKKIILSEDTITKGSTLKKMIEIVDELGGEVVAITCVGNRYGKEDFNGIPLISCFVLSKCNMFYDDETPEENRGNNPRLPNGSEISEKPKNDWQELIKNKK